VGKGGSKFCGALSLYNIWGSLCGKEYKISITKLGMHVNIYSRPLPRPWKGP